MAEIYIDYATNINEELKKQDLIDVKIEILYDMEILINKYVDKHTAIPDTREDEVRELLSKCNSRHELDTILHDVVRGNVSLNELLNRGIVCLKGGDM